MRKRGKAVALGLGLGWAVVVLVHYSLTVGSPVDAWCFYGLDPGEPIRRLWPSDYETMRPARVRR